MDKTVYDKLLPEEKLILHDNCFTCKHRNGSECTILNIRERKTYYDLDFVCDFYNQKTLERSGENAEK